MGHYWKHWSASTIGLTVNRLAIDGDVFHELQEEQRGLSRIIPHDTNAISPLMLRHKRTYSAFACSQRGFGWMPGKGSPVSASVCWDAVWEPKNGKGLKNRNQQERANWSAEWVAFQEEESLLAGWDVILIPWRPTEAERHRNEDETGGLGQAKGKFGKEAGIKAKEEKEVELI